MFDSKPSYLIAAAGGVISSLAYAPVALWPFFFLGCGLFLWGLRRTKRPGLLGLCYGLGFFLPLLHWTGTFVGWLPWLALALLQALFFTLFARLASTRTSPWQLAALWVGIEALRSRIPWGGFGWGRAAFSQVDAPTALLSSLGGAALLSFVTVLFAAAVVHRQWKPFLLLLLIPLAALNFPQESGDVLRVAGVQGNVPRLGLDFNAQREAVLSNHIQATQKIASGSVDLVVWPENASDVDPYQVQEKIQAAADHVQAPILVGGVPRLDGDLYNASILWLPQSGPSSQYLKIKLAPFGEYIPLRSLAEALVPAAARVENFTAGEHLVLHPVGGEKVASIICFEVLNDGLIRQNVRDGATLLAVQTNSATFGRSSESAQQLAITRLRAIEHARAVASVSTSGLSALISPRGELLDRSDFFETKILKATLPVVRDETISDRLGGWSELLLVILPWLGVRRRR